MRRNFFIIIFIAFIFAIPTIAQWRNLSNPQLGDILQCKFISPQKGWIASVGGALSGLLQTTDGGESWTRILQHPPGAFNWIYNFDLIDDSLGYAVSLAGRFCYRTLNGGKTWESTQCANPNAIPSTSIKIFSPALAFHGGDTLFKRSVDTLRTWQVISLVRPPSSYDPIFRFVFFSKDTIVASGGLPPFVSPPWIGTFECYKSTNGGMTWGFPYVDTLAPTAALSFANKSVGYAFHTLNLPDMHYKTHKTTDGGQTWFQIPASLDTSAYMRIYDAYFKNPSVGFVSGDGLAFTSNGGINWTTIRSVKGTNVIMSWYDSLHGWAFGDSGRIYKTTSGGWLPIQLASFTGRHLGGTRVRLDWRTLSETNNFGFYVQRRWQTDSTFTEISSLIPGYGTTNEPHDYSYIDSNATIARWYYRLKQVDLGGPVHFTEPILVDVTTSLNEQQARYEFRLEQNYPNPFNPTTQIRFSIPTNALVELKVLDILGREVTTLVNEVRSAGTYEEVFDASRLASGVYIYKLLAHPRDGGQVENFLASKKFLLMK